MLPLALLVLPLLLLLLIVWVADSTCVVVYGRPSAWAAFLQGFRSVYPNAQFVCLPDPEVDFTAYCDALETAVPRFDRLVCQVPCHLASDLLRKRRRPTVVLDGSPDLMQPCVTCNIVASEQAVAAALTRQPDTGCGGKKLLLSEAEVTVPKGWMQLRTAAGAQAAVQSVSGLQLGVIAVTVPTTRDTVQALAAGSPRAQILARTADATPVPGLTLQVYVDGRATGQLAAAMLRGLYRGPRDIVVQPSVVADPERNGPVPCTSLSQLAS